MNNDLISRYALRKSVTDELERLYCVLYKHNEYYQATKKAFNTVLDFIDRAPTVEPEVKKVPIASVTFDTEKLKELTDEIVDRIKNGEIVLQDERPQGEWKEFAEFVAKEVCTDNFKDNSDSFAELACRKLVKLGLLKLDGDTYKKGGAE